MTDPISQEKKWAALTAIVKRLPAQLTYYTSALGAIVLAGGGQLPLGLEFVAGGIGANLLSNLIDEVARGKALSDDELSSQVEEAVQICDIANLLTKQDFLQGYARLIQRLDTQKEISSNILDELQSGFDKVATGEQVEELKTLLLQIRMETLNTVSKSNSRHLDVFISSTSRDLSNYRDAVTKVVLRSDMYPIIMEAFNPTDRNALQLCYDKVQEAEIFIGIYAHRYGYAPGSDVKYTLPDGREVAGDGETSITHLEYLWALERDLPMLLFVVSEEDASGTHLAWPTTFVEGEPGISRLKNFKKLIMGKHVVGFFHSPDHLASQAATGLLDFLLKQPITSTVSKHELSSEYPLVVGERLSDISSYFRDRDSQRREIGRLLAGKTTRVISVIGRGGIGKTAVVSQVLAELENGRWPYGEDATRVDGIAYLSTRTRGISLERIFLDCANLVDTSKRETITATWTNPNLDHEEKILRLFGVLKDGFYILLLDNMEDILDDNQEILDSGVKSFIDISLRSPHNSRLLITTREPLSFSREMMRFDNRIFMKEGLPTKDAVEVLKDLDPHGEYGLRDANELTLYKIAEKVHGIPRALEIIASILANDPFTDIYDLTERNELFDRDEFVVELARENYQNMNDYSRYVVEALAVFGRPVPMAGIQFILHALVSARDIQVTLTRLIRIHAVNFDRGSKLVSLHPIDRDYIYRQIPEQGDRNRSRKALENKAADYYSQLSLPPEQWQVYEDLDYRIYECEHLIRAEEYERVFAKIPYNILYSWGYYDRLDKLYQPLEEKLNNPLLLVHYLSNRGNIFRRTGYTTEAIKYYENALKLIRSNGFEGEANHLAWLGHCYFELVDIPSAVVQYQEALEIDRKQNNKIAESWRLRSLGWCIKHIGEISEALGYVNQALQIVDDIDASKNERATCLFTIAQIYLDLGRNDLAEQNLSLASRMFAEINETVWLLYVKLIIAELLIQKGEITESIQLLNDLIKQIERINDVYIHYHLYEKLGRAYLSQGDLSSSRQALSKGRKFDYPRDNHNLILLIALVELLDGRISEASDLFSSALLISENILQKNNNYYSALAVVALSTSGLYVCGEPSQMAKGYLAIEKIQEIIQEHNAVGIKNNLLRLSRYIVSMDIDKAIEPMYKKLSV